MKYIQTTADTAHKGQHVPAGSVLAFDEDSYGDANNYLAAKRGVEVDEETFKASRKRGRGAPESGSES